MLQKYEINHLAQLNYFFKNPAPQPRCILDEHKEAELNWNSSVFIAELLLSSKSEITLNLETVASELETYNAKNGTNILLDELLENTYIRVIVGRILIPDALSSISYMFSTEKEQLNEYKNSPNYQAILFIYFLHNKYGYEDSRKRLIKKTEFNRIYNNFKKLYPEIPSKVELKKDLKIKAHKSDSKDFLEFTPSGISDKTTPKTAAYIWNALIKKNDYPKNIGETVTKLKNWLEYIQFCNTQNFLVYLSSEQQKSFCEAAIKLLQEEDDLLNTNGRQSILKEVYDSSNFGKRSINLVFYPEKFFQEPFLKNLPAMYDKDQSNKTFFYKWIESEQTRNSYHNIDFFTQKTRKTYYNLIMNVLSVENEFLFQENIEKIFLLAKERPYVLFSTIHYLKNNKPEALIMALDHKDFGLICLSELIEEYFIKNTDGIIPCNTSTLIEDTIILFCKQMKFQPDVISELMVYLSYTCFIQDYRTDKVQIKTNLFYSVKNKIQLDFSSAVNTRNASIFFSTFKTYEPLFFNSEYNFICELSYFIFLYDFAKISQNDETKFQYIKKIIERLEYYFLREKINTEMEYESLSKINWAEYLLFFFKSDKLKKFSSLIDSANVNFKNVRYGSDYDSLTTNAFKIRFYLSILCNAYISSKNFILEKSFHNKLEKLITKEISTVFRNKDVNIFDEIFEGSLVRVNKLLPILMKSINQFSVEEKTKIINEIASAIFKAKKLTILFSVFSLLDNNETKNIMSEYLRNINPNALIKSINSIPYFIETTINVFNSGLAKECFDVLIKRLDTIIDEKNENGFIQDFTFNYYFLKLYQLYFEKNVEVLKNLRLPEKINRSNFSKNIKTIENQRKFYLIKLEVDNSKIDKTTLNKINLAAKELVTQEPNNKEYLSLKLYIDLLVETKKGVKANFTEILSEVDNIIECLNDNTIHLSWLTAELAYYTKLKILSLKKDEKETEDLFYSMPSEFQTEIKFKSLIKPQKQDKETLKKLQDAYKSILNDLDDYDRYKVIPISINPRLTEEMGDYIFAELLYSIQAVLRKIATVNKIEKTLIANANSNTSKGNISKIQENNKTYLINLIFSARLSMLKYNVPEQDPSAISGTETGENEGELDIVVKLPNSEIVMEAVEYFRGIKEIEKHISKSFNYGPSRENLFDLIYYTQSDKNFKNAVDKIDKKISEIKYPQNYELISKTKIETHNKSIIAWKSIHKSGLVFYHILINFSYIEKPSQVV